MTTKVYKKHLASTNTTCEVNEKGNNMKVIIALGALVVVAVASPIDPPLTGDQNAVILKNDQSNYGNGEYNYAYRTSNGIDAQETGTLVNPGTDQESNVVHGHFSYIGPDGVQYTVQYVADANGFHPQGEHLPANQ